MGKLFANIGDPDQMPHSAASDLGLHCLPSTLLRVSQLHWVKHKTAFWEVHKVAVIEKELLLREDCSTVFAAFVFPPYLPEDLKWRSI